MLSNLEQLAWLKAVQKETLGCFFYTTEEEFFSITVPYLYEGLKFKNERCLWILPPHYSFAEGVDFLEEEFEMRVRPFLRSRRLLLIQWDNWFGNEVPVSRLIKKMQDCIREAIEDSFNGFRILGHSPERTSPYWKEFYLYEEAFAKRFRSHSIHSLSAYSVIDCPVQAISSIAHNYKLCLIHRGNDWDWMHRQSETSKQLLSR